MKMLSIKGMKLPAIGLGTGGLTGEAGQKIIVEAIGLGYRHLDTAQMYGNEADVGAAIKTSGIARGDIFVTTKIDNANHGPAVRASVEESLRKLGVSYIDLLLVHWPSKTVPLNDTIAAMAALQRSGKVRHLGVSNFTSALLADAARAAGRYGIALAVNQVEYHLFMSQKSVLTALKRNGMAMIAYCPVAKGAVAKDPTVMAIAQRLDKTPGQIALRWLVDQEGVAAIPKATNPAHLKENLKVFDFALSPSDKQALDKLGSPKGRLVNVDWAPAWDAD